MQKIKLIKMMSSPVDSSVALSTTCSITAKHTVNALRRCEERSCQTEGDNMSSVHASAYA